MIFEKFDFWPIFWVLGQETPYLQGHFFKCLGSISKNGFQIPLIECLNYVLNTQSLTYLIFFHPRKLCNIETDFGPCFAILPDPHLVPAILKYQNSTNCDENCFILLQMSQNYIYNQFEIHLINFEVFLRA